MLAVLAVAVLLAGCSTGPAAPIGSTTGWASNPPAWASGLTAQPVTGNGDAIYISGTVGSTLGVTLTGADTPFGRAHLTATSGCIGGGPEPMSAWRISAGESIRLVPGSGYLAVWEPTGLPAADQGEMTVTLHFADAPDLEVTAAVQPLLHETPPAESTSDCGG
jgi:hypothetical protein